MRGQPSGIHGRKSTNFLGGPTELMNSIVGKGNAHIPSKRLYLDLDIKTWSKCL